MHPQRDPVEGIEKVQVRGRVVERVDVEHHQGLHLVGPHLVDQLAKLLQLGRGREGIDRLGVVHRFAYRAQRGVDGVRQRMGGRGLPVAHHHQDRAPVLLQIFYQRGGKFLLFASELAARLVCE